MAQHMSMLNFSFLFAATHASLVTSMRLEKDNMGMGAFIHRVKASALFVSSGFTSRIGGS